LWWRWNTLSWLYCTSSRLTATTKGLDMLLVLSLSPANHGMQADGTCDVSRVLQLCGGGAIHSPRYTAHRTWISFRWCLWLNRASSAFTDKEGVPIAYRQWGNGKKKLPAGQDSNLPFPHYPKGRLTSHYMHCHEVRYQLHHPDWR